MKPKTLLQKEVWSLHQTLRPVTQKQLDWGAENAPQHHCLHNPKTHLCVCMECGYKWKSDSPTRCPNCGRSLTVSDRYLKRTFEDHVFFNVIQKKGRFMVIRVFYTYKKVWRNKVPNVDVEEVIQHWIDETGRETIIARPLSMCYYRQCPFSLGSPMSIKKPNASYYWVDGLVTYPLFSRTATLRRNGLKSSLHGIKPTSVIRLLLSDNRFETMWKLGMHTFARYYANSPTFIGRYWPQLLRSHRIGYKIEEPAIWFDYLELLESFGKDINCPKYIFPADYRAEHDRYVEKKRRRDEAIRQQMERERRAEEERRKRRNRTIFRKKSKYFGITFGNRNLQVIVLSSIKDYKREGDLQHHCVYTNAYYGKEDSIILSARLKKTPDIPVETVELSLENGSILQCFGKYNQYTEYHKSIINLVSRNAGRFINKS